MNKIVVGLIFGLVLGALDGATAWFYPEARSAIGGILVAALDSPDQAGFINFGAQTGTYRARCVLGHKVRLC